MKHLKFVINGRVVRKLCMACKVGYTADPETLRRLNMSPDKVGKLFQARTQPLRDPKGNPIVCEFCQDMHFVDRVGVYETFVIDDEVRAAMIAGGSVNQLKALFRKQRQKYLQEAALARGAWRYECAGSVARAWLGEQLIVGFIGIGATGQTVRRRTRQARTEAPRRRATSAGAKAVVRISIVAANASSRRSVDWRPRLR